MATPQPILRDATLRHAVLFERLKAGEIKKILPFLRAIEKDVRERLTRDTLTDLSRARLNALLDDVEKSIATILKRWEKAFVGDLRAIANSEAAFQGRALKAVVGMDTTLPSSQQLMAAVYAIPLTGWGSSSKGGVLVRDALKQYSEAQQQAIVGAIRQGYYEGATNNQILQRIRGTRKNRFNDGVIAYSKRQNEALVRTSLAHASSVARSATLEQNGVERWQWVSTLDSRTTPICQALDGKIFKVGEKTPPPEHWNCRSTAVPVLDEEYDYLDKGATRASKDGPVPATETYYSWLKGQPASFQDKAIGPVRGKLLREGGLSADRFARMQISRNYQPLTLAEMQKLEPLAFKRAGIKINPDTGRVIGSTGGGAA